MRQAFQAEEAGEWAELLNCDMFSAWSNCENASARWNKKTRSGKALSNIYYKSVELHKAVHL